MNRTTILASVAAIAVVGAGSAYAISAAKAHRAAEAEAAALAEQERQAEEARVRAERFAYLRAAPESEFVAIGERCIDEIEAVLHAEEGLIWNFVDLDPAGLREIETAVAMGLQITAMGELAALTTLVQAQVERARQRVAESDYGSAEMAFVVSEVSDSIVGRVEKLVSYKCVFENPESLVVFASKSVVLS